LGKHHSAITDANAEFVSIGLANSDSRRERSIDIVI